MSPKALRRLSDERLSSRLAAGDAEAFDAIYERYSHRLAAYGAHLLGDDSAGEDVAQAALLKAYQALRSGRRPDQLRPWLYRIAHNAAIDLLARRRELLRPNPDDAVAADPHERSSLRGALVGAFAALPERQRHAYMLRELHGLRVAEIAAELGLTQQQVEQALFSARTRLAELIVFGGRLRCDVARRLAQGELDRPERRALKAHLRTCPSCRSVVSRRSGGLGLLPLAGLDWLRGAVTGLIGGGAPAVKVGAVVATATVAAGAPLALHDEQPRVERRAPVAMSQASKPAAPRARVPAIADRAQAPVRVSHRAERRRDVAERGRDGRRRRDEARAQPAAEHGGSTGQRERAPTAGPGPDADRPVVDPSPPIGEPVVPAVDAAPSSGSGVPGGGSNEGTGSASSGPSGGSSSDGRGTDGSDVSSTSEPNGSSGSGSGSESSGSRSDDGG